MRKKAACKNKPHAWSAVTKPISIWPYEVELYRQCLRCGKKRKGVIL